MYSLLMTAKARAAQGMCAFSKKNYKEYPGLVTGRCGGGGNRGEGGVSAGGTNAHFNETNLLSVSSVHPLFQS